MSLFEAMMKASVFIDQHLTELCQEMVKYKETGVHEGGRISEVTNMISAGTGINHQNSRSIVESSIALAAMTKCAGTKPAPRTDTYIQPESIRDISTERDRY